MSCFRIDITSPVTYGWLMAILLVSFCRMSLAQEHEVRFERFSTEHGLSQYSILCMLQDQQGFFWIGTQDGLNRYDGYHFTSYRHDPADSTSLADDHIYALHEDQAGRLWIGTRTGWLSKFDRASGRFVHFSFYADSLHRSAATPIYDIAEGHAGELWLATDAGLLRFDPRTERFTQYRHIPQDSTSLRHDAVRALVATRSGRLWVGSLKGLDAFDPTTGRFTRIHRDAQGGGIDSVRTLLAGRDETLWIGTLGQGLVRYHTQTHEVKRYRHQPDEPGSLSSDNIFAMAEDRHGRLWVGTASGLSMLDPVTGRFTRHMHDPEQAYSLSYDEVLSIVEDRTGVLWIGTWSGLNKLSPLAEAITRYGYSPDGTGLSNPRVVAIHEDSSGILWVGTLGGGLNRVDRTTGQVTYFTATPDDTTSLGSSDVTSILEDSKGRLWVGTLGGGLNLLDPSTGQFRRYQHQPTVSGSLSSNNVISVYEDRAGMLWLGTTDGGLNQFDPETGTIVLHRHTPDDSFSLGNDYAWPILEDRAGALWIGTIDGGLNRLDRATGRFTRYYHDAQDSTSLSSNRIYCLLEDAAGVLWIGTTEGLSRLDKARQEFRVYREDDGLPHNHVVGILSDDNGNLWLSTNNGLSRFNPRTEHFANYTTRDGLPSTVFHVGASYKSHTGELFFGGANGLLSIHPSRIESTPEPPPVVLTDVSVYDQPLSVDGSVEALQQVTLKYNENFFTFGFAALDFAAPDQNRYSYLLEGFDDGWSPSSSNHTVRYTNVPPGTYTFRVRAANRDGAWNEVGLALPVRITPPFWQTWQFRLLVFSLVLLLLFTAYKYRVRQLLRVERMRMRIAGDLHDDIGANLSSIAIKSEMVLGRNQLDEQGTRQLSEISRTARETAHTLREIVWVVNADYDTLDKLITKLEDTTGSMLDGCLPYTFARPQQPLPQQLSMDFRQNIFFLYKEILNNIIKHAQATHIDIAITLRRSVLVVQVEDDGVGFAEGQVRLGNGLRLMRRRAEQLHGQLTIESNPGEGTRIVLMAPLE